jgi:hypothetical protein
VRRKHVLVLELHAGGTGLPALSRTWRGGACVLAAAFIAADARAAPFAHSDSEEDSRGREQGVRTEADPIRGSTFLFDQSASVQTVHLDPSAPLSYVPSYIWWLSLRPRWNFSDNFRVQARFDYYKEFTNSQDTTLYRENVFGDIGTDAVFSDQIARDGAWRNTRLTLGLRAAWPTSLQSQGTGIYVTLGGVAGLLQKIPIRGDSAKVLSAARLGLSFVYLHPFSHATTATEYGNFSTISQSDSGMSAPSDQLTGVPLASHILFAITEASLQITPKLGFDASAIWIDQWHYAPTRQAVQTDTGSVTPTVTNVGRFTQVFWVVAALNYELIDEVSLSAGYLNLANVIGLNGMRRSPFLGGEDNAFWSPDASFFFDVTVNLDKIWERARRGGQAPEHPGDTAREAQKAREARLLGTPVR